ncbi:MAG: phosphoadenylyl-sulfate reductase [Bacteroidota bacterium]|nr:phosphoadenylyl-sulfate reductase [Bacteroidota bacterium]
MKDISVRFGPGELEAAAAGLEGRSAIDVIEWASARFGARLVFATAFGPAGCVLVDMIGRRQLPIDIFTLDTGLFFEETYALWRSLEDRYGLTVRQVTPATPLTQQAREYGERLWQRNPDLCCSIRKVAPMQAELSRANAWISSIQRTQTPERAHARVVEWDQRFGIAKINPLVHWTKHEVWRYIRTHRVPYNPLHDNGYPSIGCWPCTSAVGAEESDRAGRWRNRAKNECGLHCTLISAKDTPCAVQI